MVSRARVPLRGQSHAGGGGVAGVPRVCTGVCSVITLPDSRPPFPGVRAHRRLPFPIPAPCPSLLCQHLTKSSRVTPSLCSHHGVWLPPPAPPPPPPLPPQGESTSLHSSQCRCNAVLALLSPPRPHTPPARRVAGPVVLSEYLLKDRVDNGLSHQRQT